MNSEHNFYMKLALKQAEKAFLENEVPVGAVIVNNITNKVVAKAHNLVITNNSPMSHAEILAISAACIEENNYRLVNHSLYVTLEPCLMCAGAIIHSRISNVYFGASDEKFGAIINNSKVFINTSYNHKPFYEGGILKEESKILLKNFFKQKRKK